ncbi:MAG: DUF2958 domain-containing protein [Bradyrhizobium sp.]|uniref:DUF2958 domain-containing protein n=1 Tax=Bradyrhizobium sp. TaxID=376 RepID=UPI003BF1DF00
MILLTDDLRERLLANGLERGADHVPVVKFFNPLGEGVWLATERNADGDTLFGLADLGYPELGSFSLEELASIVLPFGMRIERDILFTGDFPISVWAEAAREAGSIRAAERILYERLRLDVTARDAHPELRGTGDERLRISGFAPRIAGRSRRPSE